MHSRHTNIAPARRNSYFGATTSIFRRSSLGSVPEDGGYDDDCNESHTQELQKMRAKNGGRRHSIASSASSSMSSTKSFLMAKAKRSAGSRRKRNKLSSSTPPAAKRRDSLGSTSSWASGKSGSVVSMSEEELAALGWAGRARARSGKFFRKRQLASEIIARPPVEDGSSALLCDLRALALSEGGEQARHASEGATADHPMARHEQRPPRPSRPSQRAMMRFMPNRTVQARVDDLFAHERNCFDAIKTQWQLYENQLEERQKISYSGKRRSKSREGVWSNVSGGGAGHIARLTDEQYLHVARAAKYDEGAALTLLRESNRRMLGLTCAEMEPQLETKTLFVIPGLQSREGYDVFYMRPSRYFPKQTETSTVIDNLAYVMKAMLERERSSTDGIAFMANMAGWEMTNFSMSYCLQFMKCLQAEHFPVEVRCFLIIDPPTWFDKIWKIMKTMLTPSFQKRVHIIPNSQLDVYLRNGYRAYLPDDMIGGENSTEEMIKDFIEYRKYAEYVAEYGEVVDEGKDAEEEGRK